ncbi:hypothetical protein EWM64_g253 [Hericium alpestre]|uniref:BTB domain-containing protein n=1 Tax=Hericium alpestre TaxID=135208 RepID=A0A4Z0AAI5_9AGAM|nr:hypothetical protein EWM64_g253 [Hericium alpestre]
MTATKTPSSPQLSAPYEDAQREEQGSSNAVPQEEAKPTLSPKEDLSIYKEHERFYFDDGNVFFLVEDILYGVHRSVLCRDSAHFVELLAERRNSKGGQSSPGELFIMDDVKRSEFEALLSVLYPSDFHESELKTVEEWASVLRLATLWSFSSIRKLPITRLEPIASPVDKIVFGRTYTVDDWLVPGFDALCQREQPLSKEEGHRLGIDDAMLVASLREGVRDPKVRRKPGEITRMIQSRLSPIDAPEQDHDSQHESADVRPLQSPSIWENVAQTFKWAKSVPEPKEATDPVGGDKMEEVPSPEEAGSVADTRSNGGGDTE